jgi:branched-chain amino acid transport system ATP-binding protein
MLEVKEVRVFYDKVEALKGVSLTLVKGEIAGVLGANGSGKSTLLRTICGLKVPRTGEVLFDGKDIKGKKPQEIVKMGIALVPEGKRLFPYMTVLENLLVGAYVHSSDKPAVGRSLANVYGHFPRLEERKGQLAVSLSGGEQQMLAMGRSLMAQPRILLLDEPSMGLAPFMKKEIGKIVRSINLEGVSILLVEQNAVMALKMVSKAYAMQTGKIIAQGTPSELAQDDQIRKAYLGG